MKDYINYNNHAKDILLNSSVRMFNIQMHMEGQEIKIEDKIVNAIVRNHGNPTNEFKEERYLITKKDINVKRGYLINYLDGNYIILTDIDKDNPIYDTSKMVKCDKSLNFLNSKGDTCSTPCIFEDATKYSNGIFENKNIQVGDTRQQLVVQKNPNTEEFYIGKRLLIDKIHAYKISDIKPSSPRGLIYMILEQTEIHKDIDNLDLLIADYYGNAHEYTIEILNKNLILTTNDTYKLQVNVYDKQTKIDNPELTFDVYNKEIASIENGIITGLKEGSTDIVVRFKDIIDTINVQVVAQQTPVNNYSCEIVGKDSIIQGFTSEYIGKVYNNGIEIVENVTWSITDELGNETDYAKIISNDINKCKIQATSKYIWGDGKNKYIHLHMKSNNGECVKEILVKPL